MFQLQCFICIRRRTAIAASWRRSLLHHGPTPDRRRTAGQSTDPNGGDDLVISANHAARRMPSLRDETFANPIPRADLPRPPKNRRA